MTLGVQMNLLFKYYHCSAVGHLINDGRFTSIRYTQPYHFNDPFEFSPLFLSSESKVPAFVDEWLAASPTGANFYDSGLASMLTRGESYKLQRYFREAIGGLHGVLCLSESPMIPLMWSHYANSYNGFALGFDMDHPFFSDDANGIPFVFPVTYTSRRPAHFVFSEKLPSAAWIYQAATYKPDYWSYEREVRHIVKIENLRKVNDSLFVRDLPSDLVKCVFLGFRLQSEKQELLITAAERAGAEYIEVSQGEGVNWDIVGRQILLKSA
jgi:Protein of unknown function (DUF2971)